MTAMTHAVTDSATMLRRNLRHGLRYPALTFGVAGLPIIFLLLFVYVFGGALGAGIGGGRSEYVNYVTPGIILMTAASGSVSTAVAVSMDLTEGIIARFRTMAIARVSILTGHVLGSVITSMFSMCLLVVVAFAIGFRPNANLVEWVAVFGVMLMTAVAFTWLSVGIGVWCKTPESASNVPLPLQLMPFMGSGFVPTDSMPAGLRTFAEYQPFTPIIETLRGLLLGGPIGGSAVQATAWCAGIAVVSYVWAKHLFNRDPSTR
jgi:ABC-2 type transport system permease protein